MELEHGTEEVCVSQTYHSEDRYYEFRTLKAMAAKHLDDGGKVLAIGHSKNHSPSAESKTVPSNVPMAFPYGLVVTWS